MSKRRVSNNQRGQILIITAAAMIVLIGISALVIDLGFSWMLRRHEQNAADPAAVAAARYLPASGVLTPGSIEEQEAKRAACFYARENGFFPSASDNDGCLPSNDPDGASLTVYGPPREPLAGNFAGTPGYVQVILSRNRASFFGGIFGQTTATVTTGAVAANHSGTSNSSSLIALDPTCNNGPGGKISGSGATVKIVPGPGVTADGGYVHVNSSCATHADGAPSTCGNGTTDLKIDSATLVTPHAYVNGECTVNGGGRLCAPGATIADPPDCTVQPVTEGAGRIGDPLASLRPPTLAEGAAAYGPAFCPDGSQSLPTSTSGCDLRLNKCDDNGTPECEMKPGVYYGGWKITQSGVVMKLEPGIYVIAGGGITLNSGTIATVSGDPTVEARLMIYSTDNPSLCTTSVTTGCQGPLRFSATGDFNAKALNDNTCASQPITCPYRGILIWQDGNVRYPGAEVRLGGQNSTVVSGTIYAPKSPVTLDGGSSGTGCDGGIHQACLSVQVIAWSFDVTGGGVLEMPYDPAGLYRLKQKGLVH
jgi:hypothetical protein